MRKTLPALLAAACLFAFGACAVEDPNAKNLSQSNGPTVTTDTGAKDKAEKKDAGPKLTGAQQNAVDKANDYLGYDAFSRKGLIDQLKYDGFKEKVATFAVDYIHPDWNVQAFKKAKDYLGYDSFSKSGLIDQLKYDGFTPAQATYGANKAYK